MPKTIINELDRTTAENSASLTTTIYIPCKIKQSIEVVLESGAAPTKLDYVGLSYYEEPESGAVAPFDSVPADVAEELLKPVLITSASDLVNLTITGSGNIKAAYGSTDSPEFVDIAPDAGAAFDLAYYLLNNGFQVLLQVVVNDTENYWAERFEELKDRGLYDIKFLCMGDFVKETYGEEETFKLSDLVGCAEARGDCIALVDHPRDLSDFVLESGAPDTYAERVHEWASTASSYIAYFSPWASNTLHTVTDDNKQKTYPMLPPSFSFLVACANSLKSNPSWKAVAGSSRGIIPGLVSVDKNYGEKDIDILGCRETVIGTTEYNVQGEIFGSNDNIGIAVNVISNIKPFGRIIWGNRTALSNSGALKATSFLNIRNLACDIKKTMWQAARRYTFEQNTLSLWLRFCSYVRPILDQAKLGEGINAYKFIQDETSARGRLKARVIISPIEAVEDFELTFVLQDTVETEESVG